MDLIASLFGKPVNRISPSEAHRKLAQSPKPFLLDVRQPEEYRSGHIPGARLIPLSTLHNRLRELPKNQEIICICHSGNRSASAARQLVKAGYSAMDLRGGLIAWSRAGLPMTKGK